MPSGPTGNARGSGAEELSELFREVHGELFPGTEHRIVAVYYPYSSIKSTIRRRNGILYARVSDALRGAPQEVKRALAAILLSMNRRTECPREHRRLYRDYVNSPEVTTMHHAVRRSRARKVISGHAGRFHDLGASFRRVNARYFGNELKRPRLSWSRERTRRLLGREDEALNAVVISKSLDSEGVPDYVVDYIMYHELLHTRHPGVYTRGRLRVHTREFRAEEGRFAELRAAKRWLGEHGF